MLRVGGSLLLVTVVCLSGAAGASAAPPANDSFAAPTAITVGSSTSSSNVEATKEAGEPNHAGDPGGHSVWFSWTPSHDETVGLSTPCGFGPALDALVAVYTGSTVNALTPVASSTPQANSSCSPFVEPPEVQFTAHAGTEYRIAVDGRGGAEGSFTLLLAGAPADDDFAAATVIPPEPPQGLTGTTRLATAQPGEPTHAGDGDGHSVWFSWTPAASGEVGISTCSAFSTLDSVLAVYTGNAVGALTAVASDDDGLDPGPECTPRDSEVRLDAVAGTTYRIAVDSTGGQVGRFNLRIKGRPANDSFANPISLGSSRNAHFGSTDNKLATKEAGEPDHAGDPGGHSVWFSWTPTEAGRATFSACPVPGEGPLEAVLGVYTGSTVAALHEVASSAGEPVPTCSRHGAQASFIAAAGTTYRIAVDGKNGSEGHFQMGIEGAAANDFFAQAQQLAPEPSISNTGNTLRAGAEPGEPVHAGDSTGHSLWFKWTAPSTETLVLTACPSGEFEGAPVLAVYTGSAVDALTPVVSDDAGGSYCGAEASQVELDAVAGTEYKIAVDAKGGPGGAFSLGIEGPPSNDAFAAPQVVPAEAALITGSTRFATKEPGEPDHAGDPGGHSVWFSWTPSKSGPVAIFACPGRTAGPYATPGGIDALLGVYTGESLGALTEVASSSADPVAESVGCRNEGIEGATEVRIKAVAGTTYRIAVDAADGGEGPFTLALERGAANDAFASAQVLAGSLPLFGSVDNRFATKEAGEPDHAGDPGGHSVWFSWTAAESGPAWIGTCGGGLGGLDTLLGVYTGESLAGLTPVASDDDGPPLRSEGCRATDSGLEVDALAGTTYRIAVDGKGGTVGTSQLAIEGVPANDDFDRPQSLVVAGSAQALGSNRFATTEPGESPIAGGSGGHSIWFKWTAPHDGEFAVDTCGSSIDTLLGVYTGGAVGSLTTVATNDDGGGECSPQSRTSFQANKGATYRFAVDGKGSAVGAIVLHLEDAPANDDFAEAEAIAPQGGYVAGRSALATPESGEPSPGGHSLWYSWTPTRSGTASLEGCGSGFVPALGIFSGDQLGSLTALPTSGNRAGDCSHGTAFDFEAVAGTTYRIEVGGPEGGRLQLHLISAASRLRLLTVRADGDGAVSVGPGSGGIACEAACRYNLASGTSLQLTAEPAAGSTFLGWTGGGCSGAGSCIVDVHSDATVTASFGPAPPAESSPAPNPPSSAPVEAPASGVPSSGSSPAAQSPSPAPSSPRKCRKSFKQVHRGGKVTCVKKPAKKAHRKKHRKSHRG